MPTERPILFSTPMVQAILDNRKTMTRRLMKPQPSNHHFAGLNKCHEYTGKHGLCAYFGQEAHQSPYGQVGDLLWVREAVAIDWYFDDEEALPIKKVADANGQESSLLYRSDYPDLRAIDDDGCQKYRKDGTEASPRWTPSIHMPRWASRITLEITAIGVERLHDISGADAEAEGVEMAEVGQMTSIPESWISKGWMPSLQSKSYRAGFAVLWDQINGKKHPWESNPWIWKIAFKRLTTQEL